MDVCSLFPKTHLPTLGVSAISIVVLIAAKELNAAVRHKLPVPIPVELLFVGISLISMIFLLALLSRYVYARVHHFNYCTHMHIDWLEFCMCFY